MKKLILFILLISTFSNVVIAQNNMIDYTTPKEYEIGGIKIEGTQFLDKDVLISIVRENM